MDSSFGPLEAMRLSVLTDSPVWVILSEVSLWDRKCTERGCGVEGRAALSSSEEVLEEVLGEVLQKVQEGGDLPGCGEPHQGSTGSANVTRLLGVSRPLWRSEVKACCWNSRRSRPLYELLAGVTEGDAGTSRRTTRRSTRRTFSKASRRSSTSRRTSTSRRSRSRGLEMLWLL